MPKLFLQKDLRNEDLTGNTEENVTLIAEEYGRQLEEVYNALSANLDANNISMIIHPVSITTASTYSTGTFTNISIPNTLRRKPIEVRLGQILKDENNFSPILNPTSLQWTTGAGTILVRWIAGLENSTSYKATIICF